MRRFVAVHGQYLPMDIAGKLAQLMQASDTWRAQNLDGDYVYRKVINVRRAMGRFR